MAKLVLDLHEVFNNGRAIESELQRLMQEAIDKKIGQLILMVKEAAREFETAPPRNLLMDAVKKDPQNWPDLLCKSLGIRRNQLRVIHRRGKSVGAAVLNKSPAETRHFLCGLDERQPFIAQLRHAVTSVREAHESLKRTEITLAEGKVSKVLRQGEWFMIPASGDELDPFGVTHVAVYSP